MKRKSNAALYIERRHTYTHSTVSILYEVTTRLCVGDEGEEAVAGVRCGHNICCME